jgi:putative oxidoreductase
MSATPFVRPRHIDVALFVLRLAVGAVFIYHGSQKLFAMGIPAIVDGFTKSNVPLPAVTAPAISYLEFIGGIAALTGAFARVAATLLACDMLGAMVFVHFKNGFQLPTGYEFTLTLCCICVALALTGAGAYSFDAALALARRQR